jgi:5-methylcytosine-specific restriction protein A
MPFFGQIRQKTVNLTPDLGGNVCDPDNIGRRAPSTHADHIIPVNERPDLAWDLDNLQGMCAACHSNKTATEDSTFAKKKAA